jgi:hypothetical protein
MIGRLVILDSLMISDWRLAIDDASLARRGRAVVFARRRFQSPITDQQSRTNQRSRIKNPR